MTARSRLVRALSLALGLSPLAGAQDTHPRAPGSTLDVVYLPYECARCREEGRLTEGTPHEFPMTRMPVAELAALVGADDDWMAIETPHFRLFSDFRGAQVKFKDSAFLRDDLERLKAIFPALRVGHDGAKLDAHQRLHLYHIRAERWFSHFAALTAHRKPYLGMPERYELYLFQDYSSHHTYVDRFAGGRQDKGGIQIHFRENPNFLVFTTAISVIEKRDGKSDLALANHLAHNVAHALIDGHDNYFRETWAWLEEGLAHYYERRESTRVNNFCWAEGSPPTAFTKPNWEATIFALVRRERDPNLAQWCEKLQPGELTGVENGLSWSLVKWLVETEPLRFSKMLEGIDDTENKPSCSDCIEAAFGVSPSVLHQRWREYVLENYK